VDSWTKRLKLSWKGTESAALSVDSWTKRLKLSWKGTESAALPEVALRAAGTREGGRTRDR